MTDNDKITQVTVQAILSHIAEFETGSESENKMTDSSWTWTYFQI